MSQVINGDGVLDPLVRRKHVVCVHIMKGFHEITCTLHDMFTACLMSLQSTSPTTPVETPMHVDGTMSLKNLTSVIHYRLALPYCRCRDAVFTCQRSAQQVPAYDRSAFMAKVTAAAAEVSHLDRWLRETLANQTHADTQWLMQATADVSHKVLTVTTHAENSKDPATAVRTGCLRFIELAGTGAHLTSEYAIMDGWPVLTIRFVKNGAALKSTCILLMYQQNTWINP